MTGVPEHFCLPWLLCLEDGSVRCHFIEAPGGTGQMMAQLEAGQVDVAVSVRTHLTLCTFFLVIDLNYALFSFFSLLRCS